MIKKLKNFALRYAGSTPVTFLAVCVICILFALILVHAMHDLARM